MLCPHLEIKADEDGVLSGARSEESLMKVDSVVNEFMLVERGKPSLDVVFHQSIDTTATATSHDTKG
jgi:hypothetical protein